MSEWISAFIFGAALIAFVLGFSSVIMAFMVSNEGESPMTEKIEYGFFGATGLVLCLLMVYAI